MTDNQLREIMDKLTKCVSGIQRLEEGQSELRKDVSELKTDVSELKADVSELKAGQAKIEKEMKITNKTISILTRDSMEVRVRVEVLEDRAELSN